MANASGVGGVGGSRAGGTGASGGDSDGDSGGVGSEASTSEGLGGGQTTAEGLGGGQAASAGDDAPGDGVGGGSDSDGGNGGPAAGAGSMDAAAAGAANTAPSAFDTEEGSLDAAETTARNSATVRSTESGELDVPSAVGHATAGAQAGFEVARDVVNGRGTRAAADVLTRGPGGNLPAAGFANRSELAAQMSKRGVSAAQARGMTPFSSAAASTQALDDAARTAGRLNNLGRTVGYGLQPAIGAVQGFREVPPDATLGERIASTLGGAVQEFDDVSVSGVVGGVVGGLTAMSIVTAPAAPATGAGAAVAAGHFYDGTSADAWIDDTVENYVEPAIATAIDDHAVPAMVSVGGGLAGAWDGLRSLFR